MADASILTQLPSDVMTGILNDVKASGVTSFKVDIGNVKGNIDLTAGVKNVLPSLPSLPAIADIFTMVNGNDVERKPESFAKSSAVQSDNFFVSTIKSFFSWLYETLKPYAIMILVVAAALLLLAAVIWKAI